MAKAGTTLARQVQFPVSHGRPGGVVPILAAKLTSIALESLAISFPEAALFSRPEKVRKGLARKVEAAILLSHRYGCSGTICVSDCEGDPQRLDDLARGKATGQTLLGQPHPTACGLAVESIEAWTLGDPQAIAEVLGVSLADVKAKYPAGKHIEDLKESSGKSEHRPKALLQALAQLKHRDDGEAFRSEVAQGTDIGRLEKACPKGFAPFAAEVRREFGPS